MSSARTVIFLPFPSVYFLFPFLSVLARTCRVMFKRRGERGHSCCVHDLCGKASVSQSSVILHVEFSFFVEVF